ncbi:Endonuclease/exonuclease/phosphatase domain-containing protein, partial [Dysosmobacter welbionis]
VTWMTCSMSEIEQGLDEVEQVADLSDHQHQHAHQPCQHHHQPLLLPARADQQLVQHRHQDADGGDLENQIHFHASILKSVKSPAAPRWKATAPRTASPSPACGPGPPPGFFPGSFRQGLMLYIRSPHPPGGNLPGRSGRSGSLDRGAAPPRRTASSAPGARPAPATPPPMYKSPGQVPSGPGPGTPAAGAGWSGGAGSPPPCGPAGRSGPPACPTPACAPPPTAARPRSRPPGYTPRPPASPWQFLHFVCPSGLIPADAHRQPEHLLRQQLPVQRPLGQLCGIGGVDGGQQPHAAPGGLHGGPEVRLRRDLVHGDDLGVHGPQGHGDAQGLGAGVQHVRPGPHVHLGPPP